MPVDMKALRSQLNSVCLRALEAAAGACIQRTHYEITTEHMLAALLDMGSTDLMCICDRFKVDVSALRATINRSLDELKVGNSGRPQYSAFFADFLSLGWQVSSLELGQRGIRSGALVLALVRQPDRAYFPDYSPDWAKINEQELKGKFGEITAASTENAAASAPGAAAGGPVSSDVLTQFCSDLTGKARAGRVDPVIGREREIRQCIDILMRRYQNNPLILGEPGTGKTAIAEGLALRIVAGDVPPFLANITLLSLDVGLLSAGASVKGEFERRLKEVIKAVDASNASGKPIVLFIDEAHTLIGGGGAGNDAANLLKPALARGELRTIAATTFAEYKKYIEKDPPFAQRFGLVKLEEPSVEVCIDMLRGTKDKFESHHKVHILDDAIRAAVSMSNQYLSEQQLPRKAVSLLDTASARVAVGLSSTPGPLEDIRRRIIQIETAVKAIERDAEAGHGHDADELAKLNKERAAQQTAFDELDALWKKEKSLAQAVIKLREELAASRSPKPGSAGVPPASSAHEGGAAVPPEASDGGGKGMGGTGVSPVASQGGTGVPPVSSPPRKLEEIRKELDAATVALDEYVAKRPALVPLEVNSDIVAAVLSDWTGIPAGNMVRDQAAAMLTFEDRIGQRVVGQDHAVQEIGKRLRIAGSKLQDPVLPLAVFLLVGPSGTGKTETALAVADLIFGGERFMTAINMTEFSSSMNVSRLIGSAPGLVGFGEGGVLTEAVRKRPYSVILLDEMEKACLEVNLLFMQVFDKGSLTDSEGRSASFKNTVIIMTSNEGSQMILDMCADGARPALDEMRTSIQPILEQRFSPAFIGRTTVIPFYPLSQETLRKIIDLKMAKIRKRLAALYKLELVLTPAVGDAMAARCQQISIGARLINLIINETVLPEIARRVLEMMGSEQRCQKLVIDADASGEFTYALS
ncbi:MAG: type VI secretion system ATPase TssH [Planctomycetes bacterium]|nr:type VI secretion system ATPase TssH [Planctomycetota bacterium]